jgi:hypothetical protein
LSDGKNDIEKTYPFYSEDYPKWDDLTKDVSPLTGQQLSKGQAMLDDLNISRQKDSDEEDYEEGFFQNKFGFRALY